MITLAKSAGYCFGVKRATDIALENSGGKRIYTLGPIIHNRQAVEELERHNIFETNKPEELPKGTKIIIRSHGIGKKEYNRLEELGLEIIDATCPFVKKIHNIVWEHHNKGYQIVIFGDKNHPEVKGINGWCEESAIIYDAIPENFHSEKPVCVVTQTTSSKKNWDFFKKFLISSCQSIVFFDTICSATETRQAEVASLAKKSDCMIVVGGYESSNTKKLADICREHCSCTFHTETAYELPEEAYKYKRHIGVTAGASTPEWIIKEVINKMSEENMNMNEELSFAEQLEQTMITLKTGDVVKGTVIGITPTEVYVNLGFKADGSIPVEELSAEPVSDPASIVKIGDEIEVFVVRVNDVEGTVKLSRKKLDQMAGWKKLEEAADQQTILTGTVTEVVNGGIIVVCNGNRVFIPASQASVRYIDDLSTMLKETVSFRLIDINPRRRKLVGSIKKVASEVRKQQQQEFWSTAEVGKVYTGKVKSLLDFGAFIDLGGVDGLVHISELSWGRIKHPSEILTVGQDVEVYIKAIDTEKNKISLGYKKDAENPWNIIKENYNVGDVITAKIVRLVPFGAFAEIIPFVDGLIHISQIANQRIAKPSSVLSVGQEIEAKITEIDLEKQKISLSMKVLLPDYVEEAPKAEAEETPAVEAEETPVVEVEEAPAQEETTEE
ncbi:MAG: bifunctional 4-hydroxy-3-methylbut-2-enyl diphosphate reductase/30S ribosomal protein S1 [Eubacteriales bacterium]|nr:bifunctional 4-hydroxy-3-methylbut-2-enyl diphosphate reductase/30S ribosomal protein S1 [Eubacteriales bacterium]